MSRENVEVVRSAWDAFERGDVERAFEAFAPDVEWDVSRDIWGMVVGGGRYYGVEGVAAWSDRRRVGPEVVEREYR